MDIFISTLSSSSIILILGFLFRNLIIERLKNAVKFEYDKKLSEINADLSSKQKVLEAIRNGTLTNIAQRQNILYEKQLNAIEELWGELLKLGTAKQISAMMSSIDFESTVEAAERDQKIREAFEALNPIGLDELPISNALRLRPFVTPLTWAYYAAYEAIVMHAAIRMHMIKKGINLHTVIDNDRVISLLNVALPELKDYIDKSGVAGFHYMLEILETKILNIFQFTLEGHVQDKESIKKAADITRQAEELSSASESGKA